MKKILGLILMSAILAACSNAKDTVIPMDTAKWDTDLAPKVADLEQEDKELLAGYLARTKLSELFNKDGGSAIPIGTTVGEAIESQRQFVAERKAREEKEAAEAKALKEKFEAESKATREKIMGAITVTLVSKQRVYQDFSAGRYSDQQRFIIGVENKSDKPIIGVAGEMDFYDVFDNEVGSVNFDISETIQPGATFKWNGLRDYNQFLDTHKALWNLEEGKYTTKFTPEAVLFADGSKLMMPED